HRGRRAGAGRPSARRARRDGARRRLPRAHRVSPVRPAFELRHVVSFEDTNLVGNVYFARHLSWQGRCREMFLAEHAPDVIDALRGGLALVTLRCGCEYYAELSVLDEVAVRMRLASLVQNRIGLRF